MRTSLLALLALLVSASLPRGALGAVSNTTHPNIVFYMPDDLYGYWVGCWHFSHPLFCCCFLGWNRT